MDAACALLRFATLCYALLCLLLGSLWDSRCLSGNFAGFLLNVTWPELASTLIPNEEYQIRLDSWGNRCSFDSHHLSAYLFFVSFFLSLSLTRKASHVDVIIPHSCRKFLQCCYSEQGMRHALSSSTGYLH